MPKNPADRPAASLIEMSYEQARDELVTVVARLEAGGETLEGSLALWERGEALAARCQQWLDGARARLEAVRSPDTATDDDAQGTTERTASERGGHATADDGTADEARRDDATDGG